MSVLEFEKSKNNDNILTICDDCGFSKNRLKKNIKKTRKKFGKDVCQSCAARLSLSKKPQCRKSYWESQNVKQKHSTAIMQSDAYYNAIAERDQSGPKNGMFGKKAREETRRKMSVSRTGKIGMNATAWKGGKTSLLRRIKRNLQRNHNWFGRVLVRDGYQCQMCPNQAVDAHHIEPLSIVVRRLISKIEFVNDDERFVWLMEQPEVIDCALDNGVALCRACHRSVHQNWGSHHPVALPTI